MKPPSAKIESVTFLCTFPLIQSAIKVAGDGGMRIQLDIPDSEMNEAVRLLAMRGEVLSVTVQIDANLLYKKQQDVKSDGQGRVASESKRKPRWTATKEPGTDGAPGESGQPDADAS